MDNSVPRRPPAPSGPPAFRNRTEAGVLLAAALREVLDDRKAGAEKRVWGCDDPDAAAVSAAERKPRVFAIPRGGVAVGAAVARTLNAPLDVIMVRKIGHPEAPEVGLGAIAEDAGSQGCEPFFDEEMLDRVGLRREDLSGVVARERAELARRVAVYRSVPAQRSAPGPGRGAGDLTGQLVIVVDDGLATGVTARAALRAMRTRGAARTVLAVPVAAPGAVEAIKTETGEVVTLVTPRRFRSVGEWFADFGQLTDADVLTLLSPGGTTPRG